MSKFSGQMMVPVRPAGPLRAAAPAVTYEGGAGHALDLKSELFTLVVSDMVAEPTFYESANSRLERFVQLAEEAAMEDPAWMAQLVRWVRHEAHMRSAAVVLACAYVHAGAPNGRAVIDSACVRADEPAEVLGFWLATFGRRIPQPVKRGVADAVRRLYTERAALKYDGGSRGVRMGDVIDLVHPKPKADWQSALFRYLLDRRHNRDNLQVQNLPMIAEAQKLDNVPSERRREALRWVVNFHPSALGEAGYTWERLAGWLPGGMDVEAWEAIIPSMGYMALLRNLRNFEQAKVSLRTLQRVADRIADPGEVAKSRQFPYRFWSAYRSSGTMFFGPALERALDASLANIPTLPGRTLVAVDVSGSMDSPVSARSMVMRWEVGAVFAAAMAAKGGADLIAYATGSTRVGILPSVLRTVDVVGQVVRSGRLQHGTNTWPSVQNHFDRHDRVVVFTDMQDHPSRAAVPAGVPVYVWDLAGFGVANIQPSGTRHLLAGFSDRSFDLMAVLERRRAGWPWEQSAA